MVMAARARLTVTTAFGYSCFQCVLVRLLVTHEVFVVYVCVCVCVCARVRTEIVFSTKTHLLLLFLRREVWRSKWKNPLKKSKIIIFRNGLQQCSAYIVFWRILAVCCGYYDNDLFSWLPAESTRYRIIRIRSRVINDFPPFYVNQRD